MRRRAAGWAAAAPRITILHQAPPRQRSFFITVCGCVKLAWRRDFRRVQSVQTVAQITNHNNSGTPRAARVAVTDCGIDSPPPHVIADARLFSDKIPKTRGRMGAHAKFLQTLARDRRLPGFIRGVRDEICEIDTAASLVHIILFCRAGGNRFVG